MKRTFLLTLILTVLLPLTTIGQDNEETKIHYMKVDMAAYREDTLSEFKKMDISLIRYYDDGSVLEAEDSEGDKYRWILLKDVNSEFDDSGPTEDGSTRHYYEAEFMNNGKGLLIELIENSKAATWILYHGGGEKTFFITNKLN